MKEGQTVKVKRLSAKDFGRYNDKGKTYVNFIKRQVGDTTKSESTGINYNINIRTMADQGKKHTIVKIVQRVHFKEIRLENCGFAFTEAMLEQTSWKGRLE